MNTTFCAFFYPFYTATSDVRIGGCLLATDNQWVKQIIVGRVKVAVAGTIRWKRLYFSRRRSNFTYLVINQLQ